MFRFKLGQVVATPGALRALETARQGALDFLRRHQAGDWGEVCDEDAQANEVALRSKGPLMSVYTLRNGTRIWIITEADRSATTILLPEEY